MHLIETGSNYIAYIIRYIPDYNWFNNLDNYTPEGDLVLDLSTFQGDKIKYSLEREVIWTTIPVDTARGGWIEVCTFSSVATCDYGTSIHDRGPRCGGSLGTRLVKSCSSAYTGSGSGWGNEGGDDTSNGGGYASNNNCEEVTGTLIQDSQPISGVDTGCAVNNVTGVIAIGVLDCISLQQVAETLVLNPILASCLQDPNKCAEVGQLFDFLEANPSETAFAKAAAQAICEGGEVDFEDKIIKDSSFAGTKGDCVYELLKTTNNNLFKNVLETFTNGTAKYKLKLFVGGLQNNTNEAQTTFNQVTGMMEIRFSVSALTQSTLEIAGTIIHEGIHAELKRIIMNGNNGPNPLSQSHYDYLLSLLEFYENNGSSLFTLNNATHLYMVNLHLQPIAEAVRSLDDDLYPLSHYMWLALEGLETAANQANPPIFTDAEIASFQSLVNIPLNDDQNQECDE
ncbi:hypothetical protein [Olleya sp. Bg11-27]|uniref:hypothetical protein n=1 Tax=Olleya sp. Bg11-27 TaxID=2058135 RepID=UPI000C314EEF|nr:hypothetical protein [Olleya sp. Bg11-27]AUC74275.1 hypothetical protein CW732_00710 [Olleya sp. Bg11-27]